MPVKTKPIRQTSSAHAQNLVRATPHRERKRPTLKERAGIRRLTQHDDPIHTRPLRPRVFAPVLTNGGTIKATVHNESRVGGFFVPV